MHTESEIATCTKCGRKGARRENGIPPAWRVELQDQLLCPICWGPDANESGESFEELLRIHGEGFGNGGPVAKG